MRFRALGGAYSIDHGARTQGFDLFPAEEAPSPADAQRAIDAGPADVMLCHDYPALGYELRGRTLPDADARASAQVQSLLAQVAEAIRPKLVVHQPGTGWPGRRTDRPIAPAGLQIPRSRRAPRWCWFPALL